MYSQTLRRRLDKIGGTPTTVTPEMEEVGAAAFGRSKKPTAPSTGGPQVLPRAPTADPTRQTTAVEPLRTAPLDSDQPPPSPPQTDTTSGRPTPPTPMTEPQPPLQGFNGFQPDGDRAGPRPSTNVADVVAEIVDEDSPLMRRAATEGRQVANRRGVINSSITAGASMNAVLDRAIPMAQQTAAQRQERLMQGREFQQQFSVLQEQFAQNQALSEQDFREATGLSKQEFQQNLEAMSAQFDDQVALAEQASVLRLQEAAEQFGYAEQLSAQDAQQKLVEVREQFKGQGLLSQQEYQQTLKLTDAEFLNQTGLSKQAYQQDLALQERRIGSEIELALLDAESRSALLEQERAMRESIANIEGTTDDRANAMSMVTSMQELYQEALRSILSNPDMGAADRNALLERQGELTMIQMEMVEGLTGLEIDFPEFNPNPDVAPDGSGGGGGGGSGDTSGGGFDPNNPLGA